MPTDPVSAYKLARTSYTAYKVAERGYRQARKQVAAYAEREGISEAEAWSRVRTEAVRRGDVVITRVANAAIKHKRSIGIAAALVSPVAMPLVVGKALLNRRRARRQAHGLPTSKVKQRQQITRSTDID